MVYIFLALLFGIAVGMFIQTPMNKKSIKLESERTAAIQIQARADTLEAQSEAQKRVQESLAMVRSIRTQRNDLQKRLKRGEQI